MKLQAYERNHPEARASRLVNAAYHSLRAQLKDERSCIHPGMMAMSVKPEAKLVQRFPGGMLQPLDGILNH